MTYEIINPKTRTWHRLIPVLTPYVGGRGYIFRHTYIVEGQGGVLPSERLDDLLIHGFVRVAEEVTC